MRIFGLILVLLGTFVSFASAQNLSSDPGDYLLRAVRAVADSGRANDPAAVSAAMHLSFNNSGYTETASPLSCKPSARWKRNIYDVIGDNWFHQLPNGIRVLVFPPFTYMGGQNKLSLGSPTIEYSTLNFEGCNREGYPGLNSAQSSGYIELKNIPRYACITEEQIKAIFPSLITPSEDLRSSNGIPLPRSPRTLTYDRLYNVPDGQLDFVLVPVPNGNRPPNSSACLLDLLLSVNYPAGPLHKPQFGN